MPTINSDDYHDFVIKNGKLIGEFEQMYQKSKEIPWHQDKQEDWLDIRLTVELLKDYAPFDLICDFGCGLGYYLNILKTKIGSKECCLIGFDRAPTACRKGKEIFPFISFYTADIRNPNEWHKMRKLVKERKKESALCHSCNFMVCISSNEECC